MNDCSIISLIQQYVDMILNDKKSESIKRELVKKLSSCTFSTDRANKSLDDAVKALARLGYYVLDVTATTSKKLYVGVSELSPFYLFFETGLVWNLALNLPYIPGSVVKGILRSYMIDLCKNNAECISYVYKIFGIPNMEYHKKSNEEVLEVIGLDLSSSLIVALDSYPVSDGKILTGDIVTPHYFKGGKVVENEYEVKPVPILRVAIREGVTFRFVIGIHSDAIPLFQEWSSYLGYGGGGLSFILPLLYAFRQGIGAKTSRGYGEFSFQDFSLSQFNFLRPKRIGNVRVRVNGR